MTVQARSIHASRRLLRSATLLIALLAAPALVGCAASQSTPPAEPSSAAPAPAAPPTQPSPAAQPAQPSPAAQPAQPSGAAPTPGAQAAAAGPCAARIARVWHGRTRNDKAEEYAAYLAAAIPKFRTIPGNLGYQMMRETVGAETHFMVISYWASRDAIRAYAGDDIRKVRSLPRDPELLIEVEPTVMNYDLPVVNLDCPK